ncbi:MAG: EamA family transporter, partial [Nitrosospira sp.]|nr:EamA family transporter [Nitrosospira sp.]
MCGEECKVVRFSQFIGKQQAAPPDMAPAPLWKLVGAFAVVYLVWGSTYLFIRIGVADIPPAVLAGLRFVAAGVGLSLFGFARGGKLPRGRDCLSVFVLGIGLVAIGNGTVTWSEQWLPSGEAAFITASTALFVTLFGMFGRRADKPGLWPSIGLIIGFIGTGLMLLPRAMGHHGPAFPALVLVGSSCVWAATAIYLRNTGIRGTDPFVFTGLQMLVGGSILTAIAGASGGFERVHWTASGIGAIAYLAVFGSALAYTTYNWLIEHVRPSQMGTSGYLNPAV